MRQGTAPSTDRVNKGTHFIHSFQQRARSPCSLRYSACTSPYSSQESQSKAPHRTDGRAQFVLHHTVTVIACANRPNVQPVGRSIKWLVRATAAQAGTLSAGPGWPCFQWLPQRWVASPFYSIFFVPLVSYRCQHLCLVRASRSRARPKVGCSQGLTGLLAR